MTKILQKIKANAKLNIKLYNMTIFLKKEKKEKNEWIKVVVKNQNHKEYKSDDEKEEEKINKEFGEWTISLLLWASSRGPLPYWPAPNSICSMGTSNSTQSCHSSLIFSNSWFKDIYIYFLSKTDIMKLFFSSKNFQITETCKVTGRFEFPAGLGFEVLVINQILGCGFDRGFQKSEENHSVSCFFHYLWSECRECVHGKRLRKLT